MHRKPLVATIVLGAVVGAVVAGSGAAWAAESSRPTTHQPRDTGSNRGWDAPSRSEIAQLDR